MSSDETRKPNFLLVGAAKSGTSSLWHYLRQHPEIYMPEQKELRFLASGKLFEDEYEATYKYQLVCDCNPINKIEDYFDMFSGVCGEKAIGEASTHYLFTHRTTIPVIKKYIGDPRIIAILRDPVDRAYSAYKYTLRDDPRPYHFNESRSFEECLQLEETRIKNDILTMMHFYKSGSKYYNQVKAYLDNFTNVKICLYEDLKNNPAVLMRDVYEFLEVDSKFNPSLNEKLNVTLPDNNLLNKIIFSESLRRIVAPILFKSIGKDQSMKLYEYVIEKFRTDKIRPETREYLKDYFREDVLKLQDLINRDLSHWLK